MLEFELHNWNALRGVEVPKRSIPALLRELLDSNNEEEWRVALMWLQSYASDLGVPSEATKDVVACLVAIAIRTEGKKRSSILTVLEELTCGIGLGEGYSPQQVEWLRVAIRELSYALQAWAQLAESGSAADAVLCVDLLAYCAVYLPELEPRIVRYLGACAKARPELGEEISALLRNMEEEKQRVRKAEST